MNTAVIKRKLHTFLSDRRILYKKFTRTPVFRWLPDRWALKILFKNAFGRRLDLDNPVTFNEKLQWLKLYNRRPEYTRLVDKLAVKEFVAQTIGAQYVIPTLGVYDDFDSIDRDSLPSKFVIKTNHAGGGTGVVICHDKSTFDWEGARRIIVKSMKTDTYLISREWPYKNVKRKIFIEAFLEPEHTRPELADYKIYCFNGQPQLCQVIQNRHSGETIDFFDKDWNHQPFVGLTPKVANAVQPVPRPKYLDQMFRVAAELARGTKFVRVDLYLTGESTFFGELTFFPASGLGQFTPDKWDTIIGDILQLDENQSVKRGGT